MNLYRDTDSFMDDWATNDDLIDRDTHITRAKDSLGNLRDLIHCCITALSGMEHEAVNVGHVLYFYALEEIEKIQKELEK